MKMDNRFFHKIYVVWAMIAIQLLWTGCTTDEDRRIEDTLVFAGDNRAELERVLDYYKDRGDTLKWKAARFLIANMKDKFAYNVPELDNIRQAMIDVKTKNAIEKRWKNFSYRSLPKVYDAQVITADYLMENIELAFEAWRRYEWGKYYSFDDFCEYLLPYRIGDEPLEKWRGEYRDYFVPLLDSLYRGTDVIEAASAMQHYAERAGYRHNTDFNMPHHGALSLRKCWMGTCREYCDYIMYMFRTLGIPVTRDRYKYSPEIRQSHEWNAVEDTTGRFIPIEFHESGVKRDWENKRRKGKVYRTCFARQAHPTFGGDYYLRDVTAEYFGGNIVKVPIEKNEDGFIAVFAFEGWMPVGCYEKDGGYARIENIEPEAIFMPVAKGKDGLVENGYPFMLEGGKIRVFKPDCTKKERVRLTRKYPVTSYMKDHLYRINGTRVEASNRLDFEDTDLLTVVRDSGLYLKRYIELRPKKRYRYLKLNLIRKAQLEIAELCVYTDTAFTEKLRFDFVEDLLPTCSMPGREIDKAQDGDWLSLFQSYKRSVFLVLDFGRPVEIGGILWIPRNDDNYVKSGDCYELLYQDGANGWVSLGRKVAEDDFIEFDDVPSNALLRLHHCTKGVEEQVFLWESGKQRFLGHLR